MTDRWRQCRWTGGEDVQRTGASGQPRSQRIGNPSRAPRSNLLTNAFQMCAPMLSRVRRRDPSGRLCCLDGRRRCKLRWWRSAVAGLLSDVSAALLANLSPAVVETRPDCASAVVLAEHLTVAAGADPAAHSRSPSRFPDLRCTSAALCGVPRDTIAARTDDPRQGGDHGPVYANHQSRGSSQTTRRRGGSRQCPGLVPALSRGHIDLR